MIGDLFLVAFACLLGWQAWNILKEDRAKVDKSLNKKKRGSSSTGEAVPGTNPKPKKEK